MQWKKIKNYLQGGFREFVRLDLRWSYFVIGGLILLGIILNFVLAHGWWVWPFVFVAGFMTMINEAADRNGTGIPPLQAIALILSVIFLWIMVAVVLTWVGKPILLAVPPLLIYGTWVYLKYIKRMRLITTRREEGKCVHCGVVAVRAYVLCQNCGKDPGLDEGKPVAIGTISDKQKSRARSTLTPQSNSAAAARKEQAFFANRKKR